jgi:uncharacterized protein YodC (DUF2158 family)
MRWLSLALWAGCVACSSHADSGASADGGVTDGAPATSQPSAWGADRALSSPGSNVDVPFNFGRAIATDGADTVYAVWADSRSATSEVKLARSTDGGRTFAAEQRVSPQGVSATLPSIAADGANVYVAWAESSVTQPNIAIVRSDDRGVTWKPQATLATAPGSGSVAVAADSGHVRVVYHNQANGPAAEVYTRGSRDAGVTWDAEQRISDVPYDSWVPTVALDGEKAYVLWVDYKDANEEEYFRASTDGGGTWGPIVRLTNDAADSWAGSLVVAKGSLYCAWFDRRVSPWTDTDVESELDLAAVLVGATVPTAPVRDPSVYYLDTFATRLASKLATIQMAAPAWVASGGDATKLQALLDAYQQRYKAWSFAWAVFLKRSDDGGATWAADARVTNADGPQMRPSLVYAGGALHMVWFDGRGAAMPSNVYYKSSADGVSWTADRLLSSAPTPTFDGTMRPSIAAAGDTLHVLWADARSGPNRAAYYERFGP